MAALMALLGSEVILIACRRGTKQPVGKWGEVGPEHMSDPKYLARLNRVNIGVVLGSRSGGLCTLDIDSDDGLRDFLKENGPICDTLITRGSRGGNVWWKVVGPAPKLTPLKLGGEAWGEWRGDGAQTVIYGEHPSGVQYRMLRRKAPKEIEFDEIRFPEGTAPRFLVDGTKEIPVTERLKSSELPERTDPSEQIEPAESTDAYTENISGRCVSGPSLSTLSFEDALKLTVPTDFHRNHDLLFLLARWVKTVEEHESRKRTLNELKAIFDAWAVRAAPFLRRDLGEDDYWFEFVEAYERARFGLGVNPVEMAWERARQQQIPEVAGQFKEEGVRMLVCLCRELSVLSGGGRFFLSARTVQRLLGLNDHMRAARWLSGLRRVKILKVVEEGGPKTMKATRYLYLPKD